MSKEADLLQGSITLQQENKCGFRVIALVLGFGYFWSHDCSLLLHHITQVKDRMSYFLSRIHITLLLLGGFENPKVVEILFYLCITQLDNSH